MADSIGGLFGLGIGGDRESILNQIMKERQARNVAATQNLGKYAGLAQAGMQSAQSTQDATAKLFGIEDPRLQKQTQIQDAAEAVRKMGIDTKDPEATYKAFYEELAKRGLYGEATALIPKIQEAQAKAKQTSLEERRVAATERSAETQAQQAGKKAFQQVTGYMAEDGGALSFDPATGRYYKDGKPYGGNLIPKPTGQGGVMGMLGGVPGQPQQPAQGEKKEKPNAAAFDPRAKQAIQPAVPASNVPPAPEKYIYQGNNRIINPAWTVWNNTYGTGAYQEQFSGGA